MVFFVKRPKNGQKTMIHRYKTVKGIGMQQTVERILEGKFDYEKGALELSTPRIEITLCAGEVYTGSFTISASSKRLTEGTVYAHDIRMEILNASFCGSMTEIGYTFSAKGLEEGDVIQGDISIISNQGEYYLPYIFTINRQPLSSSLGSIKNLFHFTNLAKTSWEEAVSLFYSKDFVNIFSGNDLQYKRAYLGLSKYYGNEQNVEEFLLEINKKQPIEYILERNVITVYEPTGVVEECINITRNGWGYTNLNVKCDADYVKLSKEVISDDDFLGNYLNYSVEITPEGLHSGNNFATITFFNAFVSFNVSVVVTGSSYSKTDRTRLLEYDNLHFDMINLYVAFRARKISKDTWLSQTGQIVERMQLVDERRLVPRLFKAQMLILEERYNEAKWILDQAEESLRDFSQRSVTVWSYYLYLTTLINNDENYVDDISEEIENFYMKDPTNWKVGWFLLYLSEEYVASPSRRWLFIEKQIAEMQCNSPIFYIEAVNMLLANPGLLTKLGVFECKILLFAARNDLLTKEMISQFVYLVSLEKEYDDKAFFILEKCYEKEPSTELLSVICEYLIKGDKTGVKYYNYYLEAINEELRITNLYEYFMRSVDLEKDTEIPKMVYLYFSYDNNLEWKYKAYLYARVIRNKDKMPDVFESYKETIEAFAVDEIIHMHMSRDLAVIYRFALQSLALTDDIAKKLSKIIFMHRISIDNDTVSLVVVYQSHENLESIYPLENGVAYIPIYNKDFTVLFEDCFGNRYSKSIEYDLEKMMVPGKTATMLLPYIEDNLEFDVYACECSSEMIEINEENRDRYQRILDAVEIDDSYKTEIRGKLMQYYYENDKIRELDSLLEGLEPEIMNREERTASIRIMVARGMFDKALAWVKEYGPENVDLRDLVKLLSKIIVRSEYEEDKEITDLASYVFFKGKYDEAVLQYLVKYYHGMTRNLRKLFKAAENFDVDIYGMCESMILQMLTTGYYVFERNDIYRKYVKGGADADIQTAYIASCAFEYFVKEQLTDGLIFEEITKYYLRGEKLQLVCKLAYLKYYAENKDEIDEQTDEIIKHFLEEMIARGIYMSFFKEFVEKSTPGVDKFSDKTIIEYKTDPGKRVWIHYIIESDDLATGEYVTEEMLEMYGGVHAKAFILFFGENLLYYITEEAEGEELLTESASISKSDISRDINNSRFTEINDIVIAKTLQDYDTVNNLLLDYNKHDYVIKNLFKLL